MHDGNSGRRPRSKRGGKREFGGANSFGPEFGAPDFLGAEPGYSPYETPRDNYPRDRYVNHGDHGTGDRGSYASEGRGGFRDRNAGEGSGRPFGGGSNRGPGRSGPGENRGPRRDSQPVERGPRQIGTVKFFKQDKGFGFITPDAGDSDVFVHISAVERSGFQGLDSGMRISFETEPDRRGKGPKAVNLQLLEDDAGEASPSQDAMDADPVGYGQD